MGNIRAELITIGDEILYGQTLDTNSHFISQKFDEIGVRVIRKTTVADDDDDIIQSFSEAEARADIIIITGGLGPTSDDRTKPCLSKYFDTPLTLNEKALADVTDYFSRRGRSLTERNKQQAVIPESCEMLHNPRGTAPGMLFSRGDKMFVSIPGVPHEMKYLVEQEIIPRIKARYQLPVIYHKIIKTSGIGESFLADKIKSWEEALPGNIRLAYLPSPGELKLRLTATGDAREKLVNDVNEQVESLSPYAGEHIFGYGDDTLEHVIGKLLIDQKKTLATAESCTGGFLAHKITSIEGCSNYFKGSVVAYHNDIKRQLLKVPESVLEAHGAVSEEVVKLMAINVRDLYKTDIGVATSGIAGPGGGTPEKPVGHVWIAYADENGVFAKKMQFVKDRIINIELTATAVLYLLFRKLNKID